MIMKAIEHNWERWDSIDESQCDYDNNNKNKKLYSVLNEYKNIYRGNKLLFFFGGLADCLKYSIATHQ